MRFAGPGNPEPLGVTLQRGGANVAVFSAHATGIDFCLFDPADGSERERIAHCDLLSIGHPVEQG